MTRRPGGGGGGGGEEEGGRGGPLGERALGQIRAARGIVRVNIGGGRQINLWGEGGGVGCRARQYAKVGLRPTRGSPHSLLDGSSTTAFPPGTLV